MTEDRAYADLFTTSKKANYWNDFYLNPKNLFEHTMVQRRDRALAYVTKHFRQDARILDLGCGAGVLSEKLLDAGYAVTGVDASQDMVDLSRIRLQGRPTDRYELLQANCLSLPFADASFDLVVSLGMFGYFDEVDQALREIRRVLKPGGTFVMSVRNPNNLYLFDLAELVRMPFRLAGALFRKLARKFRSDTPAIPAASQAAAPAGGDDFRIRMFQNPPPLISGVTKRGFTLLEFDGFGYGPLSILGRELMPARASIAISDGLDAAFRKLHLQSTFRWIADVSLYVFRSGSTRS